MNKNITHLKQLAFSKVLIILTGIAAFIVATVSCQRSSWEPVETITIGMEATSVNTLIYMADEMGFFKANNLNIILKDKYPSGSAAVDSLLKGEIDIATAAELAVVRHAFEKKSIRALGNIDRFMHQYLIGRKDRGITDISDINGKRIGVPLKTGAQFNLSRFLMLNKINEQEITLVDVPAPQAMDALLNEKVDAVVTWQPYVMDIKEKLTDKVSMIRSIHNDQPGYCALISTDEFANEHEELVNRFLRSLLLAEDFLIKNNEKAKIIIQQRLNYSEEYIKTIWSEHEFSISLDQPFILAMEDQARWMIISKLTDQNTIPNFQEYVHEKILNEIKPYRVNIIR
jgi:ABC-type nitrate/sulfonate/bicarbonate transport system substrate-binding protein